MALDLWCLMAFDDNRCIDINTDPGYSRAMDPDVALDCSSGLDVTMTLISSVSHSDLDTSWSSNTNLDSGG